jgi:hypothetical protein
MLISKQVEEINILIDNNQSMVSQIGENIRVEKKINVQEAVIKELCENSAQLELMFGLVEFECSSVAECFRMRV